MKKWNEAAAVSKLRKVIKSFGGFCIKIHGHAMQEPGIPDLYVGLWEEHFWIEVKANKGPLRPKQKSQLKRLERHGIPAFVIDAESPSLWTVKNSLLVPLYQATTAALAIEKLQHYV